MKPCKEGLGSGSGGSPLLPPPQLLGAPVGSQPSPPMAVERLIGSLLSPPPLPLRTSLGPCHLSPSAAVGCPLIGSLPLRVLGSGVHPTATVTAVGGGVPPAAVVVSLWLWLQWRSHCHHGRGHVVHALSSLWSWCPPGRPHRRGCLQLILKAVGAPSLVLVAVWCPSLVPVAMWCPLVVIITVAVDAPPM